MVPGCFAYRFLVDGTWVTKEGAEVQAGEDGKPVALLVVEEEEEEAVKSEKVEEVKGVEQREGSRAAGLA